ncbi:MAG: NADH-quinone oxidoreductase subunit NuoG [Lysobacterales bacterium]
MNAQVDQAVETVSIEVDGIAMEVPKDSMIIEATDKAGIEIPRFCYHEKLSIAANCRMCLVDVEKAPKPLPACATPVMDGMKVFTKSRRAIDAQHGVMEFLLINHPLDCPICDQGGECELQDQAMGYGRSVSRFTERKRVVKDKNVGPLVQTDMTRCIHCTRCVRFLEEIAGTSEMGGTGRGDRTEIGTCIEKSIDSELSGNVIDLCPVGALTNKPFRFSARAWELMARPSQAAHDAVCSNLYYHSRQGRILRSVPRNNENRNETWISDRDRYSHFGLYAEDRALEPSVKIDGQWRPASWDEAMAMAAEALREAGTSLNVLMSSSSTTEEYFLGQRLTRALGSGNIDHRLREQDFSDDAARPTAPSFQMPLARVQDADRVLLLGSNVRHEAPILGHRVRKAWRNGAGIMAINPVDWDFHFDLAHTSVVAPQTMVAETAALAMAVAAQKSVEAPAFIAQCAGGGSPAERHTVMAEALAEAENAVVIFGQFSHSHPQAGSLRQIAAWIADMTGSAFNALPHGGNPVGAWLAGAVPHRGPGGKAVTGGKTAAEMSADDADAYLLWDFDPAFDTANPTESCASMTSAGKVVAVSSYASDRLKQVADVILPLAPLPESEGTLHNIDGTAMALEPAGKPGGACRPGWKILRRLGAELNLDGFGQASLEDIRTEMHEALQGEADVAEWTGAAQALDTPLCRVGEIPMFSVDAMCRRAEALQDTVHADIAFAGLNPEDCASIGLQDGLPAVFSQGDAKVELPVRVMSRIPRGAVWLAGATPAGAELGAIVGPVSVEKA